MAGIIDANFNETFPRTLVEGDAPLVENVTWSRLGYNEADVTDWDLQLVSITGEATEDEDFTYSYELLDSGLKITLEALEDDEFNIEDDEVAYFNLQGFVCYNWPFNESPENQTTYRDQGTATIELTVEEKGFTDEAETADLNKSEGSIDTIKKHYGSKGGDDKVTLHDGISNQEFDAGSGNDTIIGGSGNDRIKGGSGNDDITGDENDTAVFSGSGSQYNVIIDPQAGSYKVEGPDGNDQINGKMKGEFGGSEFTFDEMAAHAFDPSQIDTFLKDFQTQVRKSSVYNELVGAVEEARALINSQISEIESATLLKSLSKLIGISSVRNFLKGDANTGKKVLDIAQSGYNKLIETNTDKIVKNTVSIYNKKQNILKSNGEAGAQEYIELGTKVVALTAIAGGAIFGAPLFAAAGAAAKVVDTIIFGKTVIENGFELADLRNELDRLSAELKDIDSKFQPDDIRTYLEAHFEEAQRLKNMPNVSIAPKKADEATEALATLEQEKEKAPEVAFEEDFTEPDAKDPDEATDDDDVIKDDDSDSNINAGDGKDIVDAGDGNNTVDGGRHEDIIRTGNDSDQINGGAHRDHIISGGGHDTVKDTLGDSTVDAGGGHDRVIIIGGRGDIKGGEGSDFLTGGFKNDNISGGGGNDLIQGDPGKSFLSIGSDIIDGGRGNDVLMGGRGADVFVFETFDGNDTIAAFNASDVSFDETAGYSASPLTSDFQSGVDHVQLSGFTGVNSSNVLSSITDGADGAVFSAEGTSITFFGISTSQLTADDFIFV